MKLPLLLISCSLLYASVPVVFDQPPEPPEQFAESTYLLGWDIDMSPFAGGEDLLFAHRCIERIEGWVVQSSPLYYSTTAAARIWRLSDLILAWLPLNYLAVVVQHEVFGHGYRIRDISPAASVTSFSIGTPPPYGSGSGATNYGITSHYTTTDEAAVSMGGVESTAILALLTKYKWLEAKKVDPRQVVLYLLGQYDLPLYIGTIQQNLKAGPEFSEGHDLISYVRAVNQTYTDGHLSTGKLRSLSCINFADPFTYYALYAWIYYAFFGKEAPIPMIPLWKCGYLPGLRLGLTPFGPEYFLDNFLVFHDRPFYFYCKAGSQSGNTYYGAGFYAEKIYTWSQWSLGARLDLWRQPKLLLNQGRIPFIDLVLEDNKTPEPPLYPSSKQHAMHHGIGLSVIGTYTLSEKCGLEAEAGYKTSGFVPGESLFAAPIARLYYTLIF